MREALHKTREFLSYNVPSIIYFLTKEIILAAADSDDHKRFIEEEAEVTMIASSDIFAVAGVTDKGREREIDRNMYLKGLLRLLSKEHRRIYLITQSEAQMEELKRLLGAFENSLQIAGTYDKAGMDSVEDATNDINTVTPYVVIAVLAGNEGIDFINESRKYMNTRLMVVLQPEMMKVSEDGSLKKGFMAGLSGRLFKRIAGRYSQEQ